MKIRYFAETDTLHIEFHNVPIVETRDLDENTLLEVDAEGNISAITVEHASERAGIPDFSYEQVTARREVKAACLLRQQPGGPSSAPWCEDGAVVVPARALDFSLPRPCRGQRPP